MATDTLEDLLKHRETSAAQSAAWVSILGQKASQEQLIHSGKRMEAQVDAMLKCKYGDDYTPPGEEDDEVSPTLINCSFNGDKAVEQITDAIGDVGGSPAPTPTPAPERPRVPGWIWGLVTALSVLLGAALTYLAYAVFNGDSTLYEIVAEDLYNRRNQ